MRACTRVCVRACDCARPHVSDARARFGRARAFCVRARAPAVPAEPDPFAVKLAEASALAVVPAELDPVAVERAETNALAVVRTELDPVAVGRGAAEPNGKAK